MSTVIPIQSAPHPRTRRGRRTGNVHPYTELCSTTRAHLALHQPRHFEEEMDKSSIRTGSGSAM